MVLDDHPLFIARPFLPELPVRGQQTSLTAGHALLHSFVGNKLIFDILASHGMAVLAVASNAPLERRETQETGLAVPYVGALRPAGY